MIFSFNRKKYKLVNPNNIRINFMLSIITKLHLMQYKKYINRLKKFGLYLKNKNYSLYILILFNSSYNFLMPMI